MNAKQEQILRRHIRNKIQQKHSQILMERKLVLIQEEKLRKVIRGILLKEASEVNFDTMSKSTGINILKKTMKKIAGILQDTYMSLSSSKEQRDSFRAHILRNIVDLFIRVDLLSDRDEAKEAKAGQLPVTPETNPVPAGAMKAGETIQEEEKGKKKNVKEDIDIDVEDEGDADVPKAAASTGADKPPAGPTSDKVKDKQFISIPGEDPTGRNVSAETFPFVQKTIADDYSLLSLEKDKEEYEAALHQIKIDVRLSENWEADKLVLKCIDKWKFLQETPTLSALEAIKSTLTGIKKYLSNINIDERIESGAKKGELVHNPSTISKLGKELLGLQDSYEMAKKKVITEYREKMKMRGGGSMGALEND